MFSPSNSVGYGQISSENANNRQKKVAHLKNRHRFGIIDFELAGNDS